MVSLVMIICLHAQKDALTDWWFVELPIWFHCDLWRIFLELVIMRRQRWKWAHWGLNIFHIAIFGVIPGAKGNLWVHWMHLVPYKQISYWNSWGKLLPNKRHVGAMWTDYIFILCQHLVVQRKFIGSFWPFIKISRESCWLHFGLMQT